MKSEREVIFVSKSEVAPLAGAWIEIWYTGGLGICALPSPPLAGAWIEIPLAGGGAALAGCRPPRGGVD